MLAYWLSTGKSGMTAARNNLEKSEVWVGMASFVFEKCSLRFEYLIPSVLCLLPHKKLSYPPSFSFMSHTATIVQAGFWCPLSTADNILSDYNISFS